MIKILLCGANGRMGRVIENCVSARSNLEIAAGIDLNNQKYADFEIYKKINEFKGEADVIIDFSHPSLLNELLEYGVSRKIPMVLAGTGYTEAQLEQMKTASNEVAVFSSFNMSLGINLLADLVKRASHVLSDQFDIEIVEKHHNQKLDAPSGTAIFLAESINNATNDKYKYEYDRHSKRQKRTTNEIGIHAVRGGTIVGEHEVIFAGRDEVLTLSHTAYSRDVFAVGAVNAAIFLKDKPAGLYNMGSLLESE